MPTFHIVSLGCPKNTVDAEVMLGQAHARGLNPVSNPADADIIVINTCGFIEPAKKESIDTIFQLAKHKTNGRCQRFIVTGCLVQRYATELASEIPEIDFLIGTGDVLHVAAAMEGHGNRLQVGKPEGFLSNASTPRLLSKPGASAYVKIAEGCNRHCTFCVIPRIKGPPRSRSVDDIVREIEQLATRGVIEVNLVSQDTIRYGHDLTPPSSLTTLLEQIARVTGIRWVRVLYLYPDTLDDALLDLIGNHPSVAPYIDMPMQHASDSILSRMQRCHRATHLRRIVERIRTLAPRASLRSAFIVGFPGETEDDFEQLVSFLQWASFDHVGLFRYSDEEEAASHSLDAKVPARISYNRFRKLGSIQRAISRENNRRRIGQQLQVIVEGQSEEHEWVVRGRHGGQAPEIDGQVFFTDSDVREGELWLASVCDATDYDIVVRVMGDGPLARSRPKIVLPVIS